MATRVFHTVHRLVSARHREQEDAENFIKFLRQLAALLAAGRNLATVWSELEDIYPACSRQPAVGERDPGCCLHHVFRAQRSATMLGEVAFNAVKGPGHSRFWKQLSGAVELSQATGIPLAEVLERLADALDAGEDAEQARLSAAAGPRSTAQLLSWLPLIGIGLSAMLGTTIFDMLGGAFGWITLGVGAGLSVAGRLWTKKMIESADAE